MVLFRHAILGVVAASSTLAHSGHPVDETQKPMVLGDKCHHPAYKSHILSQSPLVIYLTDFLTAEERAHLVDITKDLFKHSAVADGTGAEGTRKTRTSQSTNVPRDDIVRCIEERALLFQGFDIPRSHMESVQLVKYAQGEHYHFHTDWFTNPIHASSALGGNRLSSFFAYVAAENITGGGTNFPMLDAPYNQKWCDYVDCDEPYEHGVTFRPVVGNAVYWPNLHPDGTGDQRNLHAGLPVTSGWKIGMNIWTRQGPLSEEIRGAD